MSLHQSYSVPQQRALAALVYVLEKIKLPGYLLASVAALALDLGVYASLTYGVGMPAPYAGAVGYVSGLGCAYALLVFVVFRTCRSRPERVRELLLFLSSGLLGTLVTFIVMTIFVMYVRDQPLIAKSLAVSCSFFAVYAYRYFIVFRLHQPDRAS